MNPSKNPNLNQAGFEHAHRRREWEAQEQALDEERRGISIDDTGDDPRVMQYRFIADILSRPRFDPMPSNLAYQVLARVHALHSAADEYVELWMQRCLCAVLVIAGTTWLALLGGRWGGQWLASLAPLEKFGAGIQSLDGWSTIAFLCIGASWALGRWRRMPVN